MRIDHLLLSPTVAERIQRAGVDRAVRRLESKSILQKLVCEIFTHVNV
jgi:exonuclease III